METDKINEQWLTVIGRSLAYLCIYATDFKGKGMTDQAKLLESLGLPRKDQAVLLGTTEGSIRALISYSSKTSVKAKRKPKPKGDIENDERKL